MLLKKAFLVKLLLVCALVTGSASIAVAAPPAQADPRTILIAARLDMESLANELLSGSRPSGWTANGDIDSASFVLDLRFDLELLAGTVMAPNERPADWFGAVRSTSWAIARDVRHDLELLAEHQMGTGNRPATWVGGDPLMNCERTLQALVDWLTRNDPAFSLHATIPGPGFCGQANEDANLFTEVIAPGAIPPGDIRADLDTLMQNMFDPENRGVVPDGWTGGADGTGIRQDLELLFTIIRNQNEALDLAGWFGLTVGDDWLVARANRHDLEALATAQSGAERLPTWTATDPLVACSRSAQNLLRMLHNNQAFMLGTAPAAPAFCYGVEIEASVFVESQQMVTDFGTGGGEVVTTTTATTTTPTGPLLAASVPVDGVLVYGDTIQNTIDDTNWARTYSFNGRSGDIIFITMNAADGTTLNPILVVMDVSGNPILADDDGGSGLNAQLRATLPGSGTYYIVASRLSSADGTTSGLFDMALIGAASEQTLASSSGGVIPLAADEVVQNTLNNDTWFRVYAFSGTAGDNVTISLSRSPDENLDPYLILLDTSENVLAANDDINADNRNARLDVTLPQSGTYYVIVSRFMLNGLSADEGLVNSGTFSLQVTGNTVQVAEAAGETGTGGGGGPESAFQFVGGIPGEAATPFAYLDPRAQQSIGQIPRGTFFTALARSSVETSRMMLVQGEGFVVWVSFPWTTITEGQYLGLPPAEAVQMQLPQLLCYALFCTNQVLTGNPLTGLTDLTLASQGGVPLPGDNLTRLDNGHVRILFNEDNVDQGWAEFRLELCDYPGSVSPCERVLRLFEFGQEVPPLRVENGYPVWRMSYHLHSTVRIESSRYYTDQLWVSHPYDDRSD